MARAFLSGFSGDPINFKRRTAPQATRGLPATTGWRDIRTLGGPVLVSPQTIQRQAINTGGAPLRPLAGKAEMGGGPFDMGDVDPADYGLIHMLANVFGQYSVTNVTGSVYMWRFSLAEATSAAAFLSLLDYDDVKPLHKFFDIALGGFTMEAAPGENFRIAFPFAAGGFVRAGDPEQETGTASTLPVVRKTWPGNWATTDDQDIWVKILTDNADGTWEVQAGLGSSTVEPTFSDTRTMTEGQWFRLFDTDGSRIGTKAEQPEAYWPVGATLVELDVFRIPKRPETIFSPSLGTSRAISSVNTSFILDGEETRVEGGWTVEAAWDTLEGRPDTGGRQSATVRRAGQLRGTITPTRDLVDLTLQYALDQGEPVSVVVDAETDEEIAAGYPYRVLVVAPAGQPEGDLFSVEPGADNREEEVALVAGVPDASLSYAGLTFGSHLEVVVWNNLSAL